MLAWNIISRTEDRLLENVERGHSSVSRELERDYSKVSVLLGRHRRHAEQHEYYVRAEIG